MPDDGGAGTAGTGGATGGDGGSAGSGASTETGGANPTGAGGTSTTTGTGGGTTTTGTGGSSTTTGTGGGSTTTGTGGSSTTTTTGTGGATGGTGGAGGVGGATPCPPEAGSPEPVCDIAQVCFSAAALGRYLKSSADGGSVSCALPTPCPSYLEFQTTYACSQNFDPFRVVSNDKGQCCYLRSSVTDGRPFIVDGRSRHAGVIERADWCAANLERQSGSHDACDGRFQRSDDRLTPAERAKLAEAWLADAKAEHASIASFARLTLQLLSLGAPAELLIATQRATGDEISHAQLCFALASRFAGRTLGPSELGMSGAVSDVTFAELAVAAVHEGCVGETTAAVLAGERLERARDPEVRAALAKIAEDEARHAELAFRTVVWAIEQGGQSVFDAVCAAFDAALAPYEIDAPYHDDEAIEDALLAHGRASDRTQRRMQSIVAREIVRPIAASLLSLIEMRATKVKRPSAETRPSFPAS